MMSSSSGTKRKASTPPDGYVCNLCHTEGHWIQQCPQKGKNKKKKSNHVPVPGVDPSQEDIERARELQKIKPPQCFCGIPSRLKKVKKSNTGEQSRAVGKYFFFCVKRKTDNPCRFARPVEDEIKPKKERLCTFFAKNGSCKKGEKCIFSHDIGSVATPVNISKKEKKSTESADKRKESTSKNTLKEEEEEGADKDENNEDSSNTSSSSSSENESDTGKKHRGHGLQDHTGGASDSSSSDSDSSSDTNSND